MSALTLTEQSANPGAPAAGKARVFILNDKTLRVHFSDDTVVDFSGNVQGPSTSVDNTATRFDGITGDIQGSLVDIDDSGNITLPGGAVVNVGALRGLRESGGVELTMGAVADGEALVRSGSTLVGTTPAAAPVSSVFTRTGAVVAASSDYDATQVDFAPDGDIAATDVQAAIVEVRDDTDVKLTGKAPTARNLTAGAGQTGGGDLSADRTFDVIANADGSVVVNANDIQVGILASDAQHGARGGGTQHVTATPSVAGFLSAADKTKLDTLVDPNLRDPKDSVRLLTISNVATLSGNQTVDGTLTAPGERVGLFGQTTFAEDGIYDTSLTAWTRAVDFQLGSGQAGAVIPVDEGAANLDKVFLVTNDDGSDIVGTDDLVVLLISAGAPRGAGAGLVLNANDLDVVANADASIVVNANDIQVGVLATDAQHGARGGGTQHADVVAAGASGFMIGADKTKLDGITAGAEPNAVDSVFGRTGAVGAATSDYDANQIDFTPDGDIAATDVQAAIVEVRDDTDTKLAAAQVEATFLLYADHFDNPNNADWIVNALAPVEVDPTNNALNVRAFDPTTEEGIGFSLRVPAGATNMAITLLSRAQTGEAGARTVGTKLYFRKIPEGAAVSATWAGGDDGSKVLDDLSFPATTEFYEKDALTALVLATEGIIADQTYQFEFTRIDPIGGTELATDWFLLEMEVEFS